MLAITMCLSECFEQNFDVMITSFKLSFKMNEIQLETNAYPTISLFAWLVVSTSAWVVFENKIILVKIFQPHQNASCMNFEGHFQKAWIVASVLEEISLTWEVIVSHSCQNHVV
jgi:hypothetical protein